MIRRLWRALKREILLGDIVAYELRLDEIERSGQADRFEVQELRGMLALARARLESEEFNPAAPAAQQGGA